MNHFANGTFDQSRTFFHGANQCTRLACSAQNFSGSLAAASYRASYSAMVRTDACWLNSLGGGKSCWSGILRVSETGIVAESAPARAQTASARDPRDQSKISTSADELPGTGDLCRQHGRSR